MLASAWAKLAAWRAGRRCKRRAGRLRGRPTQRHTTPGAAPMENPADAWTGQHPQRSGEPRGICRASHPRGAGGAAHAAGEAEEKPPRAALGLNCASIPHPGGPAPRGAREDGRIPELLLDAHELVVLAVALRAAGRPRLDLARAEADGQVGDSAVLGLPRAVGGHHAPAVLLAQLHRVDGLGDGADLVDLEEERVAGLVVNRAPHARDVGHGEVIAHHLRRPPDPLREEGPGGPVVLVEGVLDGDEGEVLAGSYSRLFTTLREDLGQPDLPIIDFGAGGSDVLNTAKSAAAAEIGGMEVVSFAVPGARPGGDCNPETDLCGAIPKELQ